MFGVGISSSVLMVWRRMANTTRRARFVPPCVPAAVRDARIRDGLTQADCGDLFGLTVHTNERGSRICRMWVHYEAGRYMPREAVLQWAGVTTSQALDNVQKSR
jgi:hypothetical protein